MTNAHRLAIALLASASLLACSGHRSRARPAAGQRTGIAYPRPRWAARSKRGMREARLKLATENISLKQGH